MANREFSPEMHRLMQQVADELAPPPKRQAPIKDLFQVARPKQKPDPRLLKFRLKAGRVR